MLASLFDKKDRRHSVALLDGDYLPHDSEGVLVMKKQRHL
jgi:hypothetical protein